MTDAAAATLFDGPVLAPDPGVHTARIGRADVDAAGQIVVTGSDDRTVRLWSAEDGALLRTVRVPWGPGDIGKVYAVAIDPCGEVIAAGGWTRSSDDDPQEQLYLFRAADGAMIRRIEGLPSGVNHLAFSRDGGLLAAALGCGGGVWVFARHRGLNLIGRDPRYGDDSYGATFAPDGRLATTCVDGKLRLYSTTGSLTHVIDNGHWQPAGVAFSPDGSRLACGYLNAIAVHIFDGGNLKPLLELATADVENGDKSSVAWSADGATLYAGGSHREGNSNPVLAWSDAGRGPRRVLSAGSNTVVSIAPLPSGDLIVASGDPWLGRIGPDGARRWAHVPAQMNPSGQRHVLAVSDEGAVVDFSFDGAGDFDFGPDARPTRPARFDVAALRLTADPPNDGRTCAPDQGTLDVQNWINREAPTLNGARLPLKRHEFSRSLAVHPDGARFALGTDWHLRTFDAGHTELWRRAAPGSTEAVNISGDGRLVVAAYGDGTIRWHRMQDGAELLALFPMINGADWVIWTPEGVWEATPGARRVLRWHVNQGWDQAADAVPVHDIPETHRPEAIPHVLPQLGTPGALAVAEMAKVRSAVQRGHGRSDYIWGAASRAGHRRQRPRTSRGASAASLRPPGCARRCDCTRGVADGPVRRCRAPGAAGRRGDQGGRAAGAESASRQHGPRQRPGLCGDPILGPRRADRRRALPSAARR